MLAHQLFHQRQLLLEAFLRHYDLDALLLSRTDNFAMATGGCRNYVNAHTDTGAASLLVRRDGPPVCVSNNIEAPRLRDEEFPGLDVEYLTFFWFEDTAAAAVERAFPNLRIASDDGSVGPNVHGQLAVLRAVLTLLEVEKYRKLGTLAAAAMTGTVRDISQGETEASIAARLISAGAARGCTVPVALVAADERLPRYRHPLPSANELLNPPRSKVVQRAVMVVGCFQCEGLIVSLTRFAHFGALSAEVVEAIYRIARVDAAFQLGTRPNRSLGDVFSDGIAGYASEGFSPDEWHNHHQGGITGYGARVFRAAPGAPTPTLRPQWLMEAAEGFPLATAYAWNPSGPGVKSEDTFLLHPDGTQELLTATPDFPKIDADNGIVKSAWMQLQP